jgi:putative membrane protein
VKRPGWLLAIAGFGFAAWLFAREDTSAIAALLAGAGAGLVLAGLTHVVSMVLNAKAWQLLMPVQARPGMRVMTLSVWVRESVNGLLPVARIGGEIISYRVLVRSRIAPPLAAASLMVDMALSVLSQMLFALAGVFLLVRSGTHAALAVQIALGLLILVPLIAVFIIVQRGGIFGALAKIAGRLFAGRLGALIDHSREADRAVNGMYARRSAIAGCFLWQCAGWLAGAIEIWAAAWFLGLPISAADAIAIEALIQAVSSAAFVVPAALGVQEGAFILAGAAVGLDAPASLSLAAARRIRDLVVFFPGLLAWSLLERNRRPINQEPRAER